MEQDGQSVTRTELNGAAAVGAALCQEMIQQGAAFCVALPYKDGLIVNEIGSMREFQKIQMEWLGMPVQMNAGRGMDYFVLQHMEEHFTRLIIISAGIVQPSEEMIEISVDDLSKEVFRLIC